MQKSISLTSLIPIGALQAKGWMNENWMKNKNESWWFQGQQSITFCCGFVVLLSLPLLLIDRCCDSNRAGGRVAGVLRIQLQSR